VQKRRYRLDPSSGYAALTKGLNDKVRNIRIQTAPMSKTLYIHIGHYKTGTTALQIFLEERGAFLGRKGIQYPDVWRVYSKHSDYAFSILRAAGVKKLMYNYNNPTTPAAMWGELFKYIQTSVLPTTVISSEEFMRMGEFPEASRILREVLASRPADLQVKVIAYLRAPGAHLQSWYNQLIKMNYPVADQNAALTSGDIERIHYDYRTALQPWVDALGAENVIVRPYRNDRQNRAALHQDFMSIFGVDLAPEMVATEDPNPRLDDRMIELVRLMQNAEFPAPTIQNVRRQAQAYFSAQDALAPKTGDDMETVHARALEGLDWLGRQAGGALPLEAFRQHLPQPASQETVDRNLLLGFVFSEFLHLRRRVNGITGQDLAELGRRLDRIEAQLSGLNEKA